MGDDDRVNTSSMRLADWWGVGSGGSLRGGVVLGGALVAAAWLLGWLTEGRALGAIGVALFGFFAAALVLAHWGRTRWWGMGLLIVLAGAVAFALFLSSIGLALVASFAGWDFD